MLKYKKNGKIHLQETMDAALAAHGNNPGDAYTALAPFIGREIIYFTNPPKGSGISRVPRRIGTMILMPNHYRNPAAEDRTMHEQCLAHARATAKERPNGHPAPDNTPTPDPDPVPTPDPMPEPKSDDHSVLIDFIEAVQREQIKDRIDPWGYRQAIKGKLLLDAGMHIDAIKDSFLIDADEDFRAKFNVTPFDLIAWGNANAKDGMCGMEHVLRVTVKAGVNGAVVGGKGIGKTTKIEEISEKDGKTLAVVSCHPEAGAAEFYGVQTPMAKDENGKDRPFLLSKFTLALLEAEHYYLNDIDNFVYVLFDEADCMESGAAKMLNRSLEQRKFPHRFLARDIEFGDRVKYFATMNTTGNGADGDYTAAERQDASFLDRFFRFRVTLDFALQRKIYEQTTLCK